MTCSDILARLTAYVDGELDDAAGSAVRGHLRTCEACRAAATAELTVRDAMADLPAVDVPRGLWTGIAAQLAAQEVADSKRSRWWLWWQAARPRLAPGLLVATAAALAVIAVDRSRARDEVEQVAIAPAPEIAPPTIHNPVVGPSVGLDCDLHAVATDGDAGAALAGMAPAIDRCYQAAADELVALVALDRPGWPARRLAEFDADLDTARRAVTAAASGRPRERAWQAVIRLLQRAVTIPLVAEVRP